MAYDGPGGSADAHGRLWSLRLPGWWWTHLDLASPGAAAGLAAEGWVPGDARDLLQDADGSPRLDSVGDVAMGVMPDFAKGPQAGHLVASWRFVMRADRILTGQSTPIHGLAAAWRVCQSENPPSGPAELVDHVLAGFAADAARRAAALDVEATEIEDELLDGSGAQLPSLGARLGRVRREATRLQRVVLPVERLTRDGVHDLPGWVESQTHDTARRRLLGAVDDLRALAEHGRALQDELSARQADAMTRNLNALSILSAVLLPPALVTGFFGMNTDGLPFKDMENGTLFAGGLAAGSIVLTLLLLHLRRKV